MDTIKRETIYLGYLNGGLKIINIGTFTKSLKVCWIRRLICDSNTQWAELFHEIYGIEREIYYENLWFEILKKRCQMVFGLK